MKKLLAIVLLGVSFQAFAQTFQVQTLQVNDTTNSTSPTTGGATFAGGAGFVGDVYSGAAFHGIGAFSSLTDSGTSTFTGQANFNGSVVFSQNPTNASTTYYPTVPTNSALQNLSTVATPVVWRLGYYASGDVPPLLYSSTTAPCTINSGAGDGGAQIPSANGKCWTANFPSGPLDVTQWGVKADGITDNTTALQAAWTFGGGMGRDIILPKSDQTNFIKTGPLTAPIGLYNGGAPFPQNPLSGIRGQGYGQTVVKSNLTTNQCALTFNAPSATYSNAALARVARDFQLWNITQGTGNGICLNQITGIEIANVLMRGFNFGLYALDSIRVQLKSPYFVLNTVAIVANSTGFSYPNQWVIVNPFVTASAGSSFLFYHASDIDIYGGDFEGNNVTNTANSTIQMYGNPINGTKGLSVYGGYYQNNGGTAEFEFDQVAGDLGVGQHLITGVDQGRISNTTFVNHSVYIANSVNGDYTSVAVTGSSFWSASPYVPNAGRSYFAASGGAGLFQITGYDRQNSFGSAVEAPWVCQAGTNCTVLSDGHIRQWGTATTGAGSPGSVAVSWPTVCPAAVDSVKVVNQTAATPTAVSYGTVTTSGTTLYSAVGSNAVGWEILCH
jgi:hypothetical protein